MNVRTLNYVSRTSKYNKNKENQ